MTRAPHTIGDEDVARVREHFTGLQTAEIIGVVAGYNATNRWTGPLRLTQQDFRDYLIPTSPQYGERISQVAPVPGGSNGQACPPAAAPRPPLESPAEVESHWERCRARTPRVPTADVSTTLEVVPSSVKFGTNPPQWVRVLANFPKAGPIVIGAVRASREEGRLDPVLKAKCAWVSARQDRAWYALDVARRDLEALGVSKDQAFALDGDGPDVPAAERVALAFARKITADPALIDDDDFAALRAHFRDAEVVEIIHHLTSDVYFNRLTEACGLPLDPPDR